MKTLLNEVERILSIDNVDIEAIKRKFESNYLHTFEWRSEQYFKLIYKQNKLMGFKDFVDAKPEQAEEWLTFNISEITRNTMQGRFLLSSSSTFANIAEMLKKEADCELAELYRIFLNKIQKEGIVIKKPIVNN